MIDAKRVTASAFGLWVSVTAGVALAGDYGSHPKGWGYGPSMGYGPGMGFGGPYGRPPMAPPRPERPQRPTPPQRPHMGPYGYHGGMKAPYHRGYATPPAAAPTAPTESNGESAAKPVESASVAVAQMRFDAPTVTIKAGGTVTWTNNDGMPHTITANDGSFGSDRLGQGGTFSQTFTEPGTYDYYCQLHPTMRGKVVVVA